MRTNILAGAAAAAALTLVTVAPAVAAPETTVTRSSVPADTSIAIPYDYDVWGDAATFTANGAVTFPLDADQYDGDFVQNTFAMSAKAPAGCVRTVESFTFGYTLAEYPTNIDDAIDLAGGVGTGDPLALTTLSAADVALSGAADIDSIDSGTGVDRVWMSLPVLDTGAPQSGVVTLAFPEPVSPAAARGYIGLGMPDAATWIVDQASFAVTDTCTSEAALPTPVRPLSVETGVAAQPLANVGMNAARAGAEATAFRSIAQ